MHEVLPGHYQIFSREGMEQVCYWDLTAAPHTDSYEKRWRWSLIWCAMP